MTKVRWFAAVIGCATALAGGVIGSMCFFIAALLIVGAILGHWPPVGRGFMWAGALLVSVFILPYLVAFQFAAGPLYLRIVAIRVMSAALAVLIIWFDVLIVSEAIRRMRIRNSPLNASK